MSADLIRENARLQRERDAYAEVANAATTRAERAERERADALRGVDAWHQTLSRYHARIERVRTVLVFWASHGDPAVAELHQAVNAALNGGGVPGLLEAEEADA